MANNLDRFKKRGAEPTAPAEWTALTTIGRGFPQAEHEDRPLYFVKPPSATDGYIKEYIGTPLSAEVCRAIKTSSISTDWTTLSDVTGSGFLLWCIVRTRLYIGVQFRITIDGITKTSAFHNYAVAVGAVGAASVKTDIYNSLATIDRVATDKPSADMTDNQKLYCKHEAAIRGLRFNTSVKIEFRADRPVSYSSLTAAADYFLDSEV